VLPEIRGITSWLTQERQPARPQKKSTRSLTLCRQTISHPHRGTIRYDSTTRGKNNSTSFCGLQDIIRGAKQHSCGLQDFIRGQNIIFVLCRILLVVHLKYNFYFFERTRGS
jgi:hypothetical protein